MFSALHTDRSSSNSVLFSPKVRSLKDALAAWLFTPARWTTSTWNLDSRRRHRASLADASWVFSSLNRGRYGFCNVHPPNIGKEVAPYVHWRGTLVASYCIRGLRLRGNEASTRLVLYFCQVVPGAARNPTRMSQASVYNVTRSSSNVNASIGGGISFSWRLRIALSSFLFISKLNGWSFRRLSLSGDANLAKCGTSHTKTLQRLKNELISVIFRPASCFHGCHRWWRNL